jgi:hypothetical protein
MGSRGCHTAVKIKEDLSSGSFATLDLVTTHAFSFFFLFVYVEVQIFNSRECPLSDPKPVEDRPNIRSI